MQAALEMLDADGLAGLSMRKLGAKLNAGATSLYWHVQTKDDLLELVADEVYSEIDVPGAELAGWRSAVTLFGHSFRAGILRHPWFTEIATTTRTWGRTRSRSARGCTACCGPPASPASTSTWRSVSSSRTCWA